MRGYCRWTVLLLLVLVLVLLRFCVASELPVERGHVAV
eukprot:COSAG06_NODE_502_length_14953_cov_15.585297_8_plen_38_part_00